MTTKITPFSDPTLEDLAKKIFDGLNNLEPGSVSSWRVLSGADPTRFLGAKFSVQDFPALIVKQESAEGEDFQLCRGEIIYLISSQLERGRSLQWVQKAIAKAIREYVDYQTEPLCIVNYSDMTARQDLVAIASSVLMKTSIRFNYTDRSTL